MSYYTGLLAVILIICVVKPVSGVVCLFHHLKTDCDYPLDGFTRSRIRATIDECEDPPTISIWITCNNPKIDWRKTFDSALDTQEIKGYFQKVYLQVKQQYSTDTRKYQIQAKVISEHMKTVDIMDSEITLNMDGCSLLNQKSQIAVAVLGSIAGVAVIAVIFIFIIKRWRMRPLTYRHQSQTALVENPELANSSLPVNSANLINRPDVSPNETRQNEHVMVTYSGPSRNDHARF